MIQHMRMFVACLSQHMPSAGSGSYAESHCYATRHPIVSVAGWPLEHSGNRAAFKVRVPDRVRCYFSMRDESLLAALRLGSGLLTHC